MRRGSNLACVLRDREYGTGYRTGGHQLLTEGDYLEDHGAKPVINQSCELSGKCRATFLTAFSSDGTKVASTHGDHTVRVTEISTGKCTHVLKGHPRTPWCVAFHPSYSQILASGCLGGEVRIWDLHGFGSEVWRCKENYVISSLAFHPTDHVLVFAVWNEIHFWDWSQPEPFTHRKTANSYERVRWLKFDPLGHFLYTGIANDTTVRPASSSRVSFINGRPADGQRVQQLSHVYDELVECFQASRRSRILQQANSQTTASHSASSDRVVPRSPVHEEGLNLARQYASHITETANQSQPSVVTTSNEEARIERVDTQAGASNAPHPLHTDTNNMGDFQRPYNWSPPPRGASAETDSDVIVEDEISLTPSNFPLLQTNRSRLRESRRTASLASSRANSSPPEGRLSSCSSNSGSDSTDRNSNLSRQSISPFVAISEAPRVIIIPDSQSDSSRSTASSLNSGTSHSRTGLFSFPQSLSRPESSRPTTQLTGLFSLSNRTVSAPSSSVASSVVNSSLARNSEQIPSHNSATDGSHDSSSLTSSSECDENCQVCRRYDPERLARLTQNSSSNNFTRLRRHHRHLHGPHERSAFTSPSGARNLYSMNIPMNSSYPIGREPYLQRDVNSRRQNLLTESLENPHTDSQRVQSLLNLSSSQLSQIHRERLDENFGIGASSDTHNGSGTYIVQDANLTNASDNIHTYDSNIHENFATITARIEREMNELDRRISALRNTFNESVRRFQQRRSGLLQQPDNTSSDLSLPSSQAFNPPLIRITRCGETSQPSQNGASANPRSDDVQRPHEANNGMLENALRTRPFIRPSDISHTESSNDEPATSWHSLERHHLHPHYSVSILDNTINRPNDPIQMAINRAIADVFMGRGEPAVAANIINQTHRIQAWDFTKCDIPDITDAKVNVIVQHCKLHNEASCDISQDGTMLTTFVPSHRGFPDDNILAVYSLLPKTRGQCLFTKSFGPNAISVSLSPMNNYVMVGLAAKRLSWVFTPNQLVARILKLENKEAGENSMQVVTDVMHPCDTDIRTHVSVNAARWLPSPGEGIVYGTNRGDLHICRPGAKITTKGDWSAELAHAESIRRHLFSMMRSNAPGGPGIPPLANTATQTLRVRRSAGTQTDTDSPEYEYRSSIV